MKEDTEQEEKKETPSKEKEESSKEYSDDSDDGVTIPEEFQKKVHALINECDNKECLSFVRECVYRKEDEIRQSEMKKKGKSVPSTYSTADMPA